VHVCVDLKVLMMCVMNGPKGPSCVWSKAPICCKKYPAVAGYFIKWTINGPKRGAKKRWPDKKMVQLDGIFLVLGLNKSWLSWK
jgi:hypothetical protein